MQGSAGLYLPERLYHRKPSSLQAFICWINLLVSRRPVECLNKCLSCFAQIKLQDRLLIRRRRCRALPSWIGSARRATAMSPPSLPHLVNDKTPLPSALTEIATQTVEQCDASCAAEPQPTSSHQHAPEAPGLSPPRSGAAPAPRPATERVSIQISRRYHIHPQLSLLPKHV